MIAVAAAAGVALVALSARRAARVSMESTVRVLSVADQSGPGMLAPGGSLMRLVVARLSALAPPPSLQAALDDAGIAASAHAVWLAWLATGGVVPLTAAIAVGPGAAAAGALLTAAGPLAVLRALRDRGASRYEGALAPALEEAAGSLRSGAGLRQALNEAASGAPPALRGDLLRVVTDAERGTGIVAALDAWVERRPLRGVRLTVAALALGVDAGGAQARAVDGVAATMRQRARAEAEARALGAQARLSAGVIAAAPVVFAALAAVLDPSTGHLLFRTTLGACLLAAGITLDLIGALWMARLSRVVRR